MPGPKPLQVTLNDKQRDFLEHLVRRQTSPQRLVRRAKTILHAAAGKYLYTIIFIRSGTEHDTLGAVACLPMGKI